MHMIRNLHREEKESQIFMMVRERIHDKESV
jgi:hypothetical protein